MMTRKPILTVLAFILLTVLNVSSIDRSSTVDETQITKIVATEPTTNIYADSSPFVPVVSSQQPKLSDARSGDDDNLFSRVDSRSLNCMASTIYREANNQPKKGKIAVGLVVLNRQKDGDYPKTICGVVYQVLRDQKTKRKVAMFSWVVNKKLPPVDKEDYAEAKEIAANILLNNYPDFTNGATHFHANYVRPAWSKYMIRTAVIGQHLFYKDRS